jgi:hypothetical protein
MLEDARCHVWITRQESLCGFQTRGTDHEQGTVHSTRVVKKGSAQHDLDAISIFGPEVFAMTFADFYPLPECVGSIMRNDREVRE